MTVTEKTAQALTVIKRLDLNTVVSVVVNQAGPTKIQVNDLAELKGLDLTENVLADGCKCISAVVDGVWVFGIILSAEYLSNLPF